LQLTDHPTASWTAQQLREAFPWDEAPRYLVHDRDAAFSASTTTAAAIGIQNMLTAPRSPWQNAYAERLIGSIRRECLDHIIIINERGLRRLGDVRRVLPEVANALGAEQRCAGLPCGRRA
jgi:putative transposase